MKTKILQVHPEMFQNEELREACSILQSDGLVAFPTETVYGLGANALHREAATKIYEAKGRPSDNPLIIHIANRESIYELASEVPAKAEALADAFWPGPLTMILPKAERVPASTTGGLDTVAIRMPSHPVALELIRQSGVYVAAPSANVSGRPSPTRADHVIEDLSGRIDMIIDGGEVGIGLESTIVDLTTEIPLVLRPGYITMDMLRDVVGEIMLDPAVDSRERKPDIVAKAPGMKYRHYAPKGQLIIIEGEIQRVISCIHGLVQEKQQNGYRVAVIATEETKGAYPADIVYSIGSRKSEGSIAAGLYDILREMDHLGAEYIFAESFEDDSLGQAIMNRMLKAAGYHLLKA
ncbi:MAG: threonylcarbamoyl-AMP synthase [Lachnospiraceae bacterium]|nr:threonylcarbamoyl-AMP synthase [Lachnospiraceae bacterium]